MGSPSHRRVQNAGMKKVSWDGALGHASADKRIEILRLIGAGGSISQAAREAGVSYKAAWQAIDTLTNLAGVTLVERVVGGTGGGGARLTDAGRQLLQAAGQVAHARRAVLASLVPTVPPAAGHAAGGAARAPAGRAEQGEGRSGRTRAGPVRAAASMGGNGAGYEADPETGEGAGQGASMGANAGVQAPALADLAGLSAGVARLSIRTSMRNQLPCTVEAVSLAGQLARVTLRLPDGAGLTSRITRESAELLGLTPGLAVLALCKATAVEVRAHGEALKDFARRDGTLLAGRATRVSRGAAGDEVALALAGGLQWVGFARPASGLRSRARVQAWVDASSVVIALAD